jgi:hypothetical protein
VTRFDLATLKSPKVFIGSSEYSSDQAPKSIDAVYNFAQYGATIAKAALTSVVTIGAHTKGVRYLATKFCDSDIDVSYVWSNFTKPIIKPVRKTTSYSH